MLFVQQIQSYFYWSLWQHCFPWGCSNYDITHTQPLVKNLNIKYFKYQLIETTLSWRSLKY